MFSKPRRRRRRRQHQHTFFVSPVTMGKETTVTCTEYYLKVSALTLHISGHRSGGRFLCLAGPSFVEATEKSGQSQQPYKENSIHMRIHVQRIMNLKVPTGKRCIAILSVVSCFRSSDDQPRWHDRVSTVLC